MYHPSSLTDYILTLLYRTARWFAIGNLPMLLKILLNRAGENRADCRREKYGKMTEFLPEKRAEQSFWNWQYLSL